MEALLADESVPYEAVEACREAGLDVLSVIELATGASDQRVLELARTQDRILVTLDADVGALAYREGPGAVEDVGGCPGAVLLRVRPGGSAAFADLMQALLDSEHELAGHYTLLHKDRIRQFPLSGIPPADDADPPGPAETPAGGEGEG